MKRYYKRFVASATGLWRKYKEDAFFRTEVNTIALQVAFSLLIAFVIGIAFNYLYRDVEQAISRAIEISFNTGISPDAASRLFVEQLQYIRIRNFSAVLVVLLAITIIFGYVIARMTLAPTRRALESQKQFISNIAHELRTPLAIIKTNTEVALLDRSLGKDATETFRRTVEELDRMSGIVNNLLSLSGSIRPERIEFHNVHLGDVLDKVLKTLHPSIVHKHIEITIRKSDFMLVWGNATALEQVVMNLFKNAVTYTPNRGRITIAIESDYNDHVELTMQDSGIGIPRKDLFRIFEPFYRGDPSRHRAVSGSSGLGLSIVNELLKLHHGKITVQSEVGRGTTVKVLLPCGRRDREDQYKMKKQKQFGEIAVDFSQVNGQS